MSLLPYGTKVFVCTRVTDMRLGFNGLIGLTRTLIDQDPQSGHVFMYVNRRRDYAKALYFSRGGFCLWAKRLEQGCFARLAGSDSVAVLNDTQLMMWIDGIALEPRTQRKRYHKPAATSCIVMPNEVKYVA